jgi:cation diffusion facilitator CzcD-associated flavoprotein CzcO
MGTQSVDVVIVGAGFHGLYQLHRLRSEGFSVVLFEASDGPGGVWRTNTYPGARVDSHVPNYQFSMETVWRDWTWSERFPGQPELLRYFDHVVGVLDLDRDISYDTLVTAAVFDDGADCWQIDAGTGHSVEAKHLVLCTGFASKPYVPTLPGLEAFEGIWHHTAKWPELQSFSGQRVGVIGTGASAVQVVQEAAKTANSLTVFQRTPVTALPMQQQSLDPVEEALAKLDYPNVFQRRNTPPGSFSDIEARPEGAMEVSAEERASVFQEAWDRGGFHFWAGTFSDILIDERANRAAYDFWRDRTRARITDPGVAAVLAPETPPYPFGTKRPSLEQDYYEVFNQDNVHLVDLRQTPIVEITSDGVLTNAEHYDVDLLVLATGFDASTGGLTQIDIRGSDGTALADAWADGVDTHLGIGIPGFPNLFVLYGPQSPSAFCNGPTCAELQGDWVIDCLVNMRDRGAHRIEATSEAAFAWSAILQGYEVGTLLGRTDSWYMGANIPGKRRQLLGFPSTDAYIEALDANAANEYDGFVIR